MCAKFSHLFPDEYWAASLHMRVRAYEACRDDKASALVIGDVITVRKMANIAPLLHEQATIID